MSELIKCKLCKGVGSFRVKNSKKYEFRYCNRCKGLGELNWVDNVFGIQRKLTPMEINKRVQMISRRKSWSSKK